MHCKQARHQIDHFLQAAQASSELTQHAAQCIPCAKVLEERTALHNALDHLHAETATLGPSIHVEQQVLAALNATTFNPRRAQHTLRWISISGLAFAALLIAAVLFTSSRTHNVVPIAEIPHEETFTAMPYVVPPAPYERTAIIRTQIPLQIMQYAGFEVRDDDLGATTLADVVYGQDGRILALRLVPQPNSTPETRIN